MFPRCSQKAAVSSVPLTSVPVSETNLETTDCRACLHYQLQSKELL